MNHQAIFQIIFSYQNLNLYISIYFISLQLVTIIIHFSIGINAYFSQQEGYEDLLIKVF
jgi:hypothetical protein